MLPNELCPSREVASHYRVTLDEIDGFARQMAKLVTVLGKDDFKSVKENLDILSTTCPTTLKGLSQDSGRLNELNPQERNIILTVLWMITRALIVRFAVERARSYGLSDTVREEVITTTEEKLMKRLFSPCPPTFQSYSQLAAYINRATTNSSRSARAQESRRAKILKRIGDIWKSRLARNVGPYGHQPVIEDESTKTPEPLGRRRSVKSKNQKELGESPNFF